MKIRQNDLFLKGYLEGYQDGIRDGALGKTAKMIDTDVTSMPITMMGLSMRACNCLKNKGCTYVADVVSLTDYEIMTMRNMGKKSASESAAWLIAHGILQSDWCKYF